MKKSIVVLLAGLLVLSILFVTGCDSDKKKDDNGKNNGGSIFDLDELSPDRFDFSIAVIADSYDEEYGEDWCRNTEYYIFVDKINPEVVVNNLTLKINNEKVIEVSVSPEDSYWYTFYDLEQGREYKYELSTSTQTYTGNLKTVYIPTSISFPEVYNAKEPGVISWSLAKDNQAQLFWAESFKYDVDEDYYSEYYKELSPSVRSYTIPANSIEYYGDNTGYWLNLTQINMTLSGKLALLSMHDYSREYWYWNYSGEDRREETIKKLTNKALELLQ